jgi:hypothetical protein
MTEKIIGITVLIILAIMTFLFLNGCNGSFISWHSKTDPNTVYTLKGKAADPLAIALAQNALTEQGRRAALEKYDTLIHLVLAIIFVVGLAAWLWGLVSVSGLSRYTWITPVAAAGGEAYIRFWSMDYSNWVVGGVVALAMGIVVYKMIEYRKERDIAKLTNGNAK